MQPATVHLRARNKEIWDAVLPFIEYLMRSAKLLSRQDSQCGMILKMDAQDADWLHVLFATHKLPLTIEIDVEAML